MCVNTQSQVNVKIIYFSPLSACVLMPMCTRTCPYTHMRGTYSYIAIWSNSTSFSLGVKIVVLFQSDVFAGSRSNRARNMISKPGPGVVFDVVNDTIARKLGKEPLTFPSTADAMQAWLHACDEGLFLPEPSKAPEPSKLKLKRFRVNRKTDEMSRLGDSF